MFDLMKIQNIHNLSDENTIYNKRGFCVVKNFINHDEIKKILFCLNEIIELLKDNGDEGSYINYADRDKKIVNSIHRLNELNHKELNDIVLRNNFQDLAEYLVNEKCTLFSMQAFLKPSGGGLPTPAHQDNAYWCHEGNGGLTLWVSLDKAGSFNSMMKFAENSNNELIEHISSINTPGSSLIIPDEKLKNYNWVQPELNQGDISVHDGLVVHYSQKNNSSFKRRGFLLNYRPVSCKKNKNKFDQYLEKLEKIYDR